MQITLSSKFTKSPVTTWLSYLLITASFLFSACSGGSSALGRQYQAETLFLLPLDMETVPHVYFQDDDGINKVILPSRTGNELLVLHTKLGNHAAESTTLDIEAEPAEIRTEDGTSFLSLNTLQEATPSTTSFTDKDKFIPFLRGRQEVIRDYHLDGWLVFEVPIDATFSLLRWEISGDVIRIDL
ncbi:MAG: hypothetical protein CL891_00600 [Dehalococcoidia bacterium]|nr:hypothetical protein [Dehalococcoidia bacterium]